MPANAHYKQGERLARELVRFIQSEFGSDKGAVADALRGAYDELDLRTRLFRGEDPWPVEPAEDQDRSN